MNEVNFWYYLRDMTQLILSPVNGWEDAEADDFDSHQLLTRGLLPFLALTAATVFVGLFYYHEAPISSFIAQSIICFIKYLATYYFAIFFFTLYLPVCIDGELSVNKLNTFVNYGVGMLAFINILTNCLPVDLAFLYILPAYVAFVLWRGLYYLNISFDGVSKFIVLILLAIIAPPYLLQYLFNFIIPAV